MSRAAGGVRDVRAGPGAGHGPAAAAAGGASGSGLGIGDRLVGAVVEFARGAGYRELTLWTNDVPAAARRIHQRHGFTLVDEKPHHSFGKDLVGQDWRLDLRAAPG
ncbi:hypothetical protein GCM10009535_26360 [Streptomyces thermocarboxydovorans]|uniref:N-acetyltransferase domain-containing protein n=1 Tax=Streptomyces thermocarboxydovorans TaxID=59298 RepID=A0ABP3SKT5_9ACTN